MKSFILSFTITALICIFFMSIFDEKSRALINSFSDKLFIAIAIIFFAGYLLSLYLGITGFAREQRLFNLLGILFSIGGICIYLFTFTMNMGSGKAKKGQFDNNLDQIEISQRNALQALLVQTNTPDSAIKFVNYWEMTDNNSPFAICVQKGNIIGLQIKNKPVTAIAPLSKLKQLNWLILDNCGLKSIAGLDLPAIQRIDVSNNQLTTLDGVQHKPDLHWLDYHNNPVTDSTALSGYQNRELDIKY